MVKMQTSSIEKIIAKNEFYRNVFSMSMKNEFSYGTIKNLNIDTDTTKKILPVEIEKDILMEPLENSLIKTYATVSSKVGLEVPIISIQLNGADYIEDKGVLQEIQATGNSVAFGRYRDYVGIAVSDTIYIGSRDYFVNTIENLLHTAVDAVELKNIFSLTPSVDHMSFYKCGITEKQGNNIYQALKAAVLDLPKAIRSNAKIVMNSSDYLTLVEQLASMGISNVPFKQEIIIEENCLSPVVGDLSYLHINYDGEVNYDVSKDTKTGIYYFTLDFYSDIQIKLKSAFRIASVS
ncbi:MULTISPECIES: phage major capsid protein [Clostridium]|uniref:phage major capsid protein n=1 Tax=Clostridium TaxID=1485 RepID=UPI0008241A42|nr:MULTISPECIES: phage major capsid protein [Clostridium]PJI08314.1 phage major capsid protein [Clostridium sp. CT7]